MKKIIIIVLLFCSADMLVAQELRTNMEQFWKGLQRGYKARYTLVVVDDENKPVSDADAKISFMMENSRWITGKTDASGRFSAEGRSRGEWRYTVAKDGFYKTIYRNDLNYHEGVLIKDGKWQPWDPEVPVVLRRIVNPIPMYAKRVEIRIPKSDEPVGYDLEVGDWIAPFGKGVNGDLLFSITQRRVVSLMDFDGVLEISFPNELDGFHIREESDSRNSDFPWRHQAPTENYINQWTIKVGYVKGKGYYSKNPLAPAYFRIRTVTNNTGEIISGHYGKISSIIEFDVRNAEAGWIRFTYYLNPTPNDRNMEFDPRRNLLKNLRSTEEVSVP